MMMLMMIVTIDWLIVVIFKNDQKRTVVVGKEKNQKWNFWKMKIGKRILKIQSKIMPLLYFVFWQKKIGFNHQWWQQSLKMMTTDRGILATKMMAPTTTSWKNKKKQKWCHQEKNKTIRVKVFLQKMTRPMMLFKGKQQTI